MNRERIRAHLIKEEGLDLKRHQVRSIDKDGTPQPVDHIGYGFNLEIEWDDDLMDMLGFTDEDEIQELTQEQADYILDWWIDSITSQISKRFGEKFTKLSPLRQECLFSMRYQMGAGGLRKFKNMWDAIDKDDWARAGEEMLDSLWAKQQSPKRAQRIAKAFEHDVECCLELDRYWDGEIDAQDIAVFGDDAPKILNAFSNQDLLDELARRLGD